MQLLPRMRLALSIRGFWEGSVDQQQKEIGLGSSYNGGWLTVARQQEYTLMVNLKRLNKTKVTISMFEILLYLYVWYIGHTNLNIVIYLGHTKVNDR